MGEVEKPACRRNRPRKRRLRSFSLFFIPSFSFFSLIISHFSTIYSRNLEYPKRYVHIEHTERTMETFRILLIVSRAFHGDLSSWNRDAGNARSKRIRPMFDGEINKILLSDIFPCHFSFFRQFISRFWSSYNLMI